MPHFDRSRDAQAVRPDRRTTRRGFLLQGAQLGAGLALAGLAHLPARVSATRAPDPFTLPPLPYPYEALEPHIDAQTMRLHHDAHHAAYVKNLSAAVAQAPELANRGLEAVLRDLSQVPEAVRPAVRNNGGGHANHTMFWETMAPRAGGEPKGPIEEAIRGAFGSFEAFRDKFNEAGAKHFGSGWVWLVRDREGQLKVVSTANQDSPLSEGLFPVMANDVWEHAYYLKYQNRRADYLKAWWNVVNWEAVNGRLLRAEGAPAPP